MQRLLLFVVLIIALSACNRDIAIQPTIDGTAVVTVSLTEAEVNTLVQTALANAANPLLRDPSVDLQNGQIVITGEHERRNASGRVIGTVTIRPTVANGTLSIQVTSASIEGFDLADERLTRFNGALATVLAGRARLDNPRAILDQVTVTADTLTIQMIVQVSN